MPAAIGSDIARDVWQKCRVLFCMLDAKKPVVGKVTRLEARKHDEYIDQCERALLLGTRWTQATICRGHSP